MRTSLKYLGWLVGTAAGVSLCITLRNQRSPQTTFAVVPTRPPRSRITAAWDALKAQPLSEFGHAASSSCPRAKPPGRVPEASCYSNDHHRAHAPAGAGSRSGSIPGWAATLLISGTAIGCLYCGAILGRRPAVSASSIDSTTVTQTDLAMPTDDRPWVSLLQAIPQPLNAQGGSFVIKVHNSGKTRALDVRIQDVIRIADLNADPDVPSLDTAPVLAVGTMLPDADFTTQAAFRTSPETVAALRDGRVRAINYMLITYGDQFHHSHITQQCFYWHAGLQSPASCNHPNLAE